MRPPGEFTRHATPEGELWLAPGFEQGAEDLGLSSRARWDRYVSAGIPAGRGRVAFVEAGTLSIAIKKLHRGGRYGRIWRDRFHSRSRLFANLAMPTLARDRGIPTPAPLALLLVPGPPALWRGWFALEAVAGGVDLIRRVREKSPSRDEWASALAVVRRLHDAGIEHPDLNLGNLLIDNDRNAWVIDLDRCRAATTALGADARIDGIRRIERSYHKTCFQEGLAADTEIDWLDLYAADDSLLATRWSQRLARDRAMLARHRRTWG